jgi:hypothetical protein
MGWKNSGIRRVRIGKVEKFSSTTFQSKRIFHRWSWIQ